MRLFSFIFPKKKVEERKPRIRINSEGEITYYVWFPRSSNQLINNQAHFAFKHMIEKHNMGILKTNKHLKNSKE